MNDTGRLGARRRLRKKRIDARGPLPRRSSLLNTQTCVLRLVLPASPGGVRGAGGASAFRGAERKARKRSTKHGGMPPAPRAVLIASGGRPRDRPLTGRPHRPSIERPGLLGQPVRSPSKWTHGARYRRDHPPSASGLAGALRPLLRPPHSRSATSDALQRALRDRKHEHRSMY